MFKPFSNCFTGRSKVMPFCGSFLLFVCSVCHAVLSVPCSLVVTCWERDDLLALLYEKFSCVFVTFSYSVLDQVCYLIVWIPDLCLLPYLDTGKYQLPLTIDLYTEKTLAIIYSRFIFRKTSFIIKSRIIYSKTPAIIYSRFIYRKNTIYH